MPLRTTLGNLLHECASKFSDRPFLTIAETEETINYKDFEALTNRIAHGLVEKFSSDLSYVTIMLENGIEYLATTYALKKIDAIEVSINPAMRGDSLARMIDLTKSKILLTSASNLNALDGIRDQVLHIEKLIIVGGSERARILFPNLDIIDFDTVLSDRTDHIASTARDTDTAAILFTSGTTGVSKGCVLSHRYAVRIAENMIGPFRVTANDCVYSPYHLSHVGPAYYDILSTMITGGRVVLRQRFSVSSFWPELKKFGVTWFLMLGSIQQLLWAAAPCPEEKEHQATRCWSTSAPVANTEFEDRFNLHLLPGGGYGSTDAGWVVVPQWNHPGGLVLPHFDVAIVDENDDQVSPGISGELVVRPKEAGVMSDGYFGMPEKTIETRRNLWFHTGDIARLDTEGRFYFMHRMSERIRVKGEMVSAYEVEEGVLTHADVEDCAAIGIPGEMVEEDIKLFVVLKPDAILSARDLRAYCTGRMAKFMVPGEIVFLDEMPRTTTGKLNKARLTLI